MAAGCLSLACVRVASLCRADVGSVTAGVLVAGPLFAADMAAWHPAVTWELQHEWQRQRQLGWRRQQGQDLPWRLGVVCCPLAEAVGDLRDAAAVASRAAAAGAYCVRPVGTPVRAWRLGVWAAFALTGSAVGPACGDLQLGAAVAIERCAHEVEARGGKGWGYGRVCPLKLRRGSWVTSIAMSR